MIKQIMTHEFFLSLPSEEATAEDLGVAQDLLDTLAAHAHECVGMAANMIGVRKRIIVFDDDGTPRAMLNPSITSKTGSYETMEGCLSLQGQRPCTRYERITVSYADLQMKQRTESFSGFTAEIIQHEIDHCDGIVI